MARATVFGAGAMGTAVAMHLARQGHQTTIWAGPYDSAVVEALVRHRRHPALPEFLPESLRILSPDGLTEAGAGIDLAVMAAHSGGARTMARLVTDACGQLPLVMGIAKGLEPESLKRMSEVHMAELGHRNVVSMGGPCLAPELAQGLPTAAVFGAPERSSAERAAEMFRSATFHAVCTDDLRGLEYCTVAKNVAAIGMGILDGTGRASGTEHRNAKAALFTQAFAELCLLVDGLGGSADTARGLAGLGDALVTSLGGRNRLFGELLGEGVEPRRAVEDLLGRGMTVEGWDSTLEVHRLTSDLGLGLPFFEQMYRILYQGAPAESVLDCLEGWKG